MFDSVLYALLRKYINDSLIGAGAIKGASCQILSIERNLTDDGTVVIFKYEDNAGGVHTSTMDVPDGAKGDKGDKGDKGNTGERGVDGEAGPAGRTATVQVGTVSSGASPSVENVGTNSDAVFNFILPKGDKGDKGEDGEDGQDGKSFDIKGQYPTYAALIAAHPTGSAGEAYFVGTDNNPDLYIWLTDDQVWLNNGKIAGVKGDKGDKGDAGFSPVASVSKSGAITTVVIRDEVGQTTAQIHDGEKGDPGVGEPTFYGTQAQWDGLTLEQKLEYTGAVIEDDYDDHEYVKTEDVGTAAYKNSTDRVSPNNTGLVESQSVYSAIQTAVSSIYTPRGDITCAELTSSLLIAANVGNVYETSDNGTTTALFLQGAGVPISSGSNVGIINAGQGRILFNLMANAFDLTSYQKKDLTQAIESATTVEGALGALSDNKAAKSEMSITSGTGADADKTTIQLKTGASATVLTQHQDITGKQPKTLDTPITVDGAQKTTVESALSALVSKKMYYSIVTANDPTAIETNFKTLMPQGVNLVFWQKGGSHEVLIVQNTDNDWYSYIWFSYGQPLLQRIHTPNGWSTLQRTDNYSTSETKTNKTWINGKPIYRKVVDIGALPNAALKTVAHGIANIDTITDYYGMVASTSKTALKIPYVATESLDYIAMYVSVTNVAVKTKQDMSAYGGYAVVEYTKTTD